MVVWIVSFFYFVLFCSVDLVYSVEELTIQSESAHYPQCNLNQSFIVIYFLKLKVELIDWWIMGDLWLFGPVFSRLLFVLWLTNSNNHCPPSLPGSSAATPATPLLKQDTVLALCSLWETNPDNYTSRPKVAALPSIQPSPGHAGSGLGPCLPRGGHEPPHPTCCCSPTSDWHHCAGGSFLTFTHLHFVHLPLSL